MKAKYNTSRTVCKVMLAMSIATSLVAVMIGCSSIGGASHRQNIAQAIQTAYDMGGREAVSNRIESLVVEGKLSASQAMRLHALAQLAYEGIIEDLATGEEASSNAAPASVSPGGCTEECDGSLPDAPSDDWHNEDANCEVCEDCKAQG